ncbi:transcriptional adapter 2-beta-like isoform X2 [Varroa jacobsoni]|uniref:Transcriptional adapter n=1 Tax=Varroa destructor TaxID=109461 RepID=A0A7M7J6W7_VARDE|nr:transcriptional adapter 2-beta-like isoform X2 [Varroa destructor]XP_022704290.1 transcriptional adapter 2-beta-like isoform X2 [Varroa jacobsoni]XP_022704292.1 transcriptional adapter 2-beta-like isoform X2 [Varroa jacobsoni]
MPGPSGGSGPGGSCSPSGGSISGGQTAEHKCVYCTSDIRGLRVRCTQQTCGPTFNLCSECFACQVELGTHRRTHSYEIIDDGNFPLFNERSAWRAVEESQLLDSVERFGFGNWEDIKTMLSGRTVEEVKAHYGHFYIDGNIGKVTWGRCGPPSQNVIDRSLPPGEPLSPSLNSPTKPPQELSVNDQLEMGYMPNRDDFEKEFDNDAENLISQLALCEDEDPTDREAKMALIDSYARRLGERVRRKKFAREHNLLCLFIKGGASPGCRGVKASSREGRMRREASEKLRPFLQDTSGEELEAFMINLESQMDLKGRIKDLSRARRNGLTRLEDLFDFEQAKKRRDKLMHRRAIQMSPSGAGAEGAPGRGSHAGAPPSFHGTARDSIAANGKPTGTPSATGLLLPAIATTTTATTTVAAINSSTIGNAVTLTGRDSQRTSQRREERISERMCGLLDDRLSQKEKRICSSLGLTAGAYMQYKILLLHQLRSGQREVGVPRGLDATRTQALLEHFYRAGWVK